MGLAMCDAYFSGGKLIMKISYSDVPTIPSVQFVLFRNPLDNSFLTAGLDGGILPENKTSRFIVAQYDATAKPAAIRELSATPWVPRKTSGAIELAVSQTGSLINLYADGVLVLRYVMPYAIPTSQCGLYCQATSNVRVADFLVETRPRTAFVIMEFSPPFENLFSEVIKPVAEKCGYKAEKADDVLGPGLIVWDITRKIQEADIVIADVTPVNANVYYEIGYAHAIGKPTILLAEKGKELPFDISGFRTLFYENSIAGKSQIEAGLYRHVEAIAKEVRTLR